MSKFKIGDKVKIPETISGSPTKNKNGEWDWGHINRAVKEGRDYLVISGLTAESVVIDNYYYKEEELELYEEPNKFKIGDKVKIPKLDIERSSNNRPRGTKSLVQEEVEALGQNFIYVSQIVDNRVITGAHPGRETSDFYAKDLELYIEKTNNMEKRNNFGIRTSSNDESYRIVQWFKENGYNVCNLSGNASSGSIYYIRDSKDYVECDSFLPTEIEVYNFSEIKNETNMSKQLTGYKLLKAIPGDSKAIGTIISTTTKNDYYELLPAFWEPQYKKEEIMNIAGYEAQFKRGSVSFGCQTFTKEEVQAIRRLWSIDSQISFKLGGTTIEFHLLDAILSKI